MKNLGLSKKTNIKGFVFGATLAFLLASGLVFAWNAIWNGTSWINSGEIIPAKQIAENFEYLYLKSQLLPDNGCPNVGDVLSWDGSKFVCQDANASTTDPGGDAGTNPELIAGCAYTPRSSAAFARRDTKCWGGAELSRASVINSIICPNNSTKVVLGKYARNCRLDGGDGAQRQRCSYVITSMGCVK